jgi:hypothetical protein
MIHNSIKLIINWFVFELFFLFVLILDVVWLPPQMAKFGGRFECNGFNLSIPYTEMQI